MTYRVAKETIMAAFSWQSMMHHGGQIPDGYMAALEELSRRLDDRQPFAWMRDRGHISCRDISQLIDLLRVIIFGRGPGREDARGRKLRRVAGIKEVKKWDVGPEGFVFGMAAMVRLFGTAEAMYKEHVSRTEVMMQLGSWLDSRMPMIERVMGDDAYTQYVKGRNMSHALAVQLDSIFAGIPQCLMPTDLVPFPGRLAEALALAG